MSTSGGNWLSTPSNGQCAAGAKPGDGSGCTWRALAPPDVIESECLRDKLSDALVSNDPSCFSDCPTVRPTLAHKCPSLLNNTECLNLTRATMNKWSDCAYVLMPLLSILLTVCTC
jgi:hypothetical protein